MKELKKIGREKNKVCSQDFNNRGASPTLMCNASKPSKKMPSYKPQPKLCAHTSGQFRNQEDESVVSQKSTVSECEMKENYNDNSKGKKKVISKNQIKYSRNKESIDFKSETKDKAMNTVQHGIPTVKPIVEENKFISSYKPKVERRFEYIKSSEIKPEPIDLDRSDASISSVFIAPSKAAKKNMDRLVKIKEKILHPGSDMSHDVDFSSMTHFSVTNGTTVMKNSVATLSIDNRGNDEDNDYEDFKNASHDISKEIEYQYSQKLLRDKSNQLLNKNVESKERHKYNPSNEELKEENIIEKIIQSKNANLNKISTQNIEEHRISTKDLHDYVNSNNLVSDMLANDPNKNMINLENILIIEK